MQLPNAGEVFEGRYLLTRELGVGGFAIVYEARDESTKRTIALKVLRPERGSYDHTTLVRFQREVSIIAGLRSPHSVRLFAHGTSAEGLLYMVFEYVPGEDLSARLETQGTLAPADVHSVLRQILGALREAHDAGLIHRDIKPQNIRVSSPPNQPIQVKLLDFGIARSTEEGSPSVTKTGELVGTPRYMSPEQLTDKRLTALSDLYSLGMVAFELLVGVDALPGSAWHDQFERLRTGHLFATDTINRIGPLLPIVQKMTARRPEERFPSAAAVLRALDGDASSGPVDRSMTLETRSPSRPTPWSTIGVLFGAILVLSVVAASLYFRSLDNDTSPPPKIDKTRENPLLKGVEPEPSSPQTTLHDVDAAKDMTQPLIEGGSPGCGKPYRGSRANAEVFMARDYDPHTKHPVVIWFMADQDAPTRVPQTEPFQRLVNDEDVLVVAPLGATKNDWRTDQADEVTRIVEQVFDDYCVDVDAVFLMSTGGSGMLTTHLACEPWVTAVAVSSFLGPPERLQRCAPVLWISAKDSLHLPIGGGKNCMPVAAQPVAAHDDVERRLRQLHGCGKRKRTTRVSGGVCRSWSCEVPFESCVVDGGIGWPGTPQAALSVLGDFIGCDEPAPSRFDATAHVWAFFQRVSSDPESE